MGGALWQMNAGAAPEKIWQKEDALDCHYATPVFYDGFLYGFHGRQEQGQELRCIDPKDGAVKWSQEMAPGALLVADGKLIIVTEQGELILAAAEPGAYRELARGQILGSEARPPAALSGGKLYARDKRRLVCIELKSEN
ncbi:MAG: PQQ-binding-like beta-propeller repeat protein [Verrucomicrobiales bacterium]